MFKQRTPGPGEEGSAMRSEAEPDDWQWFSATGRAFRSREANAVEWSNFTEERLGDRKFLTVVVRRSDGAAVVVATERLNQFSEEPDAALMRFSGILDAMTKPIDLDALEADLGMA